MTYNFPGNVRQLHNIVIRVLTKYPGQEISEKALKEELDEIPASLPATPFFATVFASAFSHGDLQKDYEKIARRQLAEGNFRFNQAMAMWEENYINAAFDMCQGNIGRAAKILGIKRTTLIYRRMRGSESK